MEVRETEEKTFLHIHYKSGPKMGRIYIQALWLNVLDYKWRTCWEENGKHSQIM